MDKIFNLVTDFKAAPSENGGIKIAGMASTNDVDRMGDIILSEAWTKGGLNNFKKNPIVLYNHNFYKPIGKVTSLQVTDKGLAVEANISKAAADNVVDLIKEGVLGTFSVGFRVRDADYKEETDGFVIKDAELFEISVVTIPANQEATFSLAKSFDSMEEYEDFRKTFTNRVDLAGQSMAKEVNASVIARDTSEGVQSTRKEIKMSGENKTPEFDLEAIATKAAEKAATLFAMKQAEIKAADEKAAKEAADAKAAKEAQELTIKSAIVTGVQTGTEKLLEDFQAKLNEKDAKMEEVLAQFKKEMHERNDEITKMRDSKRVFTDRADGKVDLSKWGNELVTAHMLGVMTNKGWNTNYARDLMQKAGIDYVTNAPDIDQEVSQRIEKEITLATRVARLFREFPVNGAATVLPIQPDTGLADWAINATSGNLENRGASNNTYQPKQVILNAYRLVSSTYMDNDVDEQVLVNLMPMLVEGVARAHARTVERTILIGQGGSSPNIVGLDGYAATYSGNIDLNATSVATGDSAVLTADLLLGARQGMGKYGINPSDLAYIVSQNSYYDLLSDAKFQTLDEVGNDLAVRVNGSLGAVYGTPVVVSDEFAAETAGVAAAFVVNLRNYIIPRLRGVLVEQDYEVMNQRRVIVASQSLGFEEIMAGDGAGTEPCVKITFTA
jgi:HK97 family phage prohead protease